MTASRTERDPAAHDIRHPEQVVDGRAVAGSKCRPDARARNALAVEQHVRHADDVPAAGPEVRARERDVTDAPGTEAKILPHDHRARTERAGDHVVEERLRRVRGERAIEAQHERFIDAGARKGVDALAQRRNLRRLFARP